MRNKNTGIALLGLLCMILVGAVIYTIWQDGQTKRTSDAVEADTQGQYISYEGRKYKKNPDIKTILFMGVDRNFDAELGGKMGDAGQADSLNLLILNTDTKKAQVMQISRDSMVQVDIYNTMGEKLASEEGQIALQYAFGDGGASSCSVTRRKVSELLGGIDIHSYIALTVDGMEAVTEAIGGVTITVPEDYTWIDPAFEQGRELTLNGEQARKYVQTRDIDELDSNNQRMERQSQYMKALMMQMNSTEMELAEFEKLYHELEPYMVTDITAEKIRELGEYEYKEEMLYLPGDVTEKDGHAAYLVNKEEMRAIAVRLFYKSK